MNSLTGFGFEQALHRGLGRAILHLQHAEQPQKCQAAVLEACLTLTAHDPQCEGPRTQYLYQAAQLSHALEPLRSALLERLGADSATDTDSWEGVQQFDLLALFARAGDRAALHTLEQVFRFQAETRSSSTDLLVEGLIQAQGAAGLVFAIRTQGQVLRAHPERSEDRGVLEEAQELLGEAVVRQVFEHHGQEPEFQIYLERIEQTERRRAETRRVKADNNEPQPYAVARACAEKRPEFCSNLLGWGWTASEADYLLAAQDVLTEQDPDILAALLCIFRSRGKRGKGRVFPLGPGRLIALAWHSNSRVSERTVYLLAGFQHPQVRDTALSLLQDPVRLTDAIALFKLNFAPGDEVALQVGLRAVVNQPDHARQTYISDLTECVRRHPTPEMLQLLAEAYQHQPCGCCRERLVRLLEEHAVLPGWLAEEASLDARQALRDHFQAQMPP